MLARYDQLSEALQEKAQHSALGYVWDHYKLAELLDDPLLDQQQAAQVMDRNYIHLVREILKTKYFDQHGVLCLDVQRIQEHEEHLRAQARAQSLRSHLDAALEKHRPAGAQTHPTTTKRPATGRAL